MEHQGDGIQVEDTMHKVASISETVQLLQNHNPTTPAESGNQSATNEAG